MFRKGLASFLPLIIHEIADIIIELIKQRREKKQSQKQ